MRRSRKSGSGKVLILVLLLLLVGCGLFFLRSMERQELEQVTSDTEDIPELQRARVYYDDSWYAMRDDLTNILVMGVDKFSGTASSDPDGYTNSQQADFLLLLSIDDADKSIRALHINRDTMAEIERLGLGGVRLGSYTGQLALAHTYGSGGRDSCSNEVRAVSRFLYDVPIAHYYSVTMDAIPVLNDMLGGVTVYVEDDFSKADPSIKQGTEQRLMGDQALHFVRERGGMEDSTNLSRMRRQRAYMEALYQRMMEVLSKDESFATRMGIKLADYSVSDLSSDQLSKLADRVKDYRFKGIESVAGEAVVGDQFMEFYADEEALTEQVIRLFFEPDPKQS